MTVIKYLFVIIDDILIDNMKEFEEISYHGKGIKM